MAKRSKSQTKPRSPKPGDVGLTIAAVVVAVWAGAPWLTPLLLTVPVAFYLAKGTAADPDARYHLFRRWSITVVVTFIAATAFAPPHAFQCVPWGAEAPERVDAWMAGTAAPPLGPIYMLVAGVAFLALTVGSAGVLGALVFSSVLALNAVYATYLFSKSYNIVVMSFVAISPWQWCFMLGMVALWTPLSVYSRAQVLRREGNGFEWETYRTRVLVGLGLFVGAFLVRLALAGVYEALVRRLTVY
jgi:hypothetical protein